MSVGHSVELVLHPWVITMVILFRSIMPPPVKTLSCVLLGTIGRAVKLAAGVAAGGAGWVVAGGR